MPASEKPVSDTNFWVDEVPSPVILKCPCIGRKISGDEGGQGGSGLLGVL